MQTLWIIGITAVFMVLTHLFFEHTIVGKALRAVAADREAASLVGINVQHAVLWSFAFGALAGGLAGVIITPLTFTSYDQGTLLGFKGFCAAMLGGVGNIYRRRSGRPFARPAGSLLGGLPHLAFQGRCGVRRPPCHPVWSPVWICWDAPISKKCEQDHDVVGRPGRTRPLFIPFRMMACAIPDWPRNPVAAAGLRAAVRSQRLYRFAVSHVSDQSDSDRQPQYADRL